MGTGLAFFDVFGRVKAKRLIFYERAPSSPYSFPLSFHTLLFSLISSQEDNWKTRPISDSPRNLSLFQIFPAFRLVHVEQFIFKRAAERDQDSPRIVLVDPFLDFD